jgi:hypothetical protein
VPFTKARPKITIGKILSILILIAVLYVVLITTFDLFRHWPYFRFFLLCVMGLSFLIISYLIRFC